MERLTQRSFDGTVHATRVGYYDIIEKLASYEEAEDQGLLLRLPCKVGDTIYLVDFEEKTFEGYEVVSRPDSLDGEYIEGTIELVFVLRPAEPTIVEGTTKETLSQYVGHFENTSKQLGNIGLAARNRGYEVNYFKDLKRLREGDEIIYRYNQFEKIYEVEKCRIIRTTEWEYLEETEENMLTLITYVENQPEYRRCVQAVEKEEEIY